MSIVTVQKCLSYMKGLSKSLQERSLDVGDALRNVMLVKSSIEDARGNVDSFHADIHQKVVDMCDNFDIEVKKPRTCGRQTKRANTPAESPEEYYRRVLTIPFLDYILAEMECRFTDLHSRATLGFKLVPTKLQVLPKADEFSFFDSDLPSPDSLEAEIKQWSIMWGKMEDKPSSISSALGECDKTLFDNIANILKICATFPVTSCECERSISVLRLLKSYLRSTMGQERLTGLALMFIHRTMYIDVQKIVAQFARLHPRRITLPNILYD